MLSMEALQSSKRCLFLFQIQILFQVQPGTITGGG